MAYKRTIRFQREPTTPPGVIRGILATDGEASDGHILSMAGATLEPGIPLLFGHDDFSGDRNLGSWIEFSHGPHAIRGEAVIELSGAPGSGTLEWRQDMAHMVAKGHVSGLSVRWEPLDEPLRRTELAADHPAFVDGKVERNPMKRYGMFFPRWRALEGSLVNLGADRQAVIGRSESAQAPLRPFWREALVGLDDEAREEEVARLLEKLDVQTLEKHEQRLAVQTLELLEHPTPGASKVAAAMPTAADYEKRYADAVRRILKDSATKLGAEIRAAVADELRRVRGR